MRRLSVLLATALLPTFAQATIWTLEYSATLTDRHTAGFDYPELISGLLTIDSDGASDIYDNPHMALWKSGPDQGSNFVNGYTNTPGGSTSQDFMSIDDGDDPDYPDLPFRDAFNVGDISLGGSSRTAFYVSVEAANGLNWLSNDNIKEFTFAGDELLAGRAYVEIENSEVTLYNGQINSIRTLQEAYYDLDYVKLTDTSKPVTTPVPEPGTLLLMLTGLFSLSIFKTRTLAGNKRSGNKKRA